MDLTHSALAGCIFEVALPIFWVVQAFSLGIVILFVVKPYSWVQQHLYAPNLAVIDLVALYWGQCLRRNPYIC